MPITGGGAGGGHEYVDRGDPAGAWDIEEGDLTLDGTWRDLDLSSLITDSDATLIHMRLAARATTANKYFQLRKNGNTNEGNTQDVFTLDAGILIRGDGYCMVDSSLYVEYRGHADLDRAKIFVRGWFKPA